MTGARGPGDRQCLLRLSPRGNVACVWTREAHRTRPLDDRDRALLDFERDWWSAHPGKTKQDAIAEVLHLSPSRYYELLGALIDSEAAYGHDPLVISRLRRRQRDRRRAQLLGEGPRSHRHH